jgi:hypothetical protein
MFLASITTTTETQVFNQSATSLDIAALQSQLDTARQDAADAKAQAASVASDTLALQAQIENLQQQVPNRSEVTSTINLYMAQIALSSGYDCGTDSVLAVLDCIGDGALDAAMVVGEGVKQAADLAQNAMPNPFSGISDALTGVLSYLVAIFPIIFIVILVIGAICMAPEIIACCRQCKSSDHSVATTAVTTKRAPDGGASYSNIMQ